MVVKKNIHIENWVANRETLERTFRVNRSTMLRLFVFAIAVPVAAHEAIRKDLVSWP